jgi:hypothetical protein
MREGWRREEADCHRKHACPLTIIATRAARQLVFFLELRVKTANRALRNRDLSCGHKLDFNLSPKRLCGT